MAGVVAQQVHYESGAWLFAETVRTLPRNPTPPIQRTQVVV